MFMLAGKNFYGPFQTAAINLQQYLHVKHFLIKGLKGNKKQCAQILANSAFPCLFRVVIMKALL